MSGYAALETRLIGCLAINRNGVSATLPSSRITGAQNAVNFLRSAGDVDVTSRLPDVCAPTLVWHARDDMRADESTSRPKGEAVFTFTWAILFVPLALNAYRATRTSYGAAAPGPRRT